jgi:hypothetical protein
MFLVVIDELPLRLTTPEDNMTNAAALDAISANLVPNNRRLSILPHFFGPEYMIRAETAVFQFMRMLSPEYDGGGWNFYELSNGGFYMAPASYERMTIESTNGYKAEVSADAAGIVACMFAFTYLCETTEQDRHIQLVYHLRGFATEHAEWSAIYRAID